MIRMELTWRPGTTGPPIPTPRPLPPLSLPRSRLPIPRPLPRLSRLVCLLIGVTGLTHAPPQPPPQLPHFRGAIGPTPYTLISPLELASIPMTRSTTTEMTKVMRSTMTKMTRAMKSTVTKMAGTEMKASITSAKSKTSVSSWLIKGKDSVNSSILLKAKIVS